VAEGLDGVLPSDAGITMTRVFEASPEDVWKEWTRPEAFADWFGGPAFEVPLETVSMDVRAGGTWRLTMIGPNRRRIEWRGEYLGVDAPNRLVFTISDDPEEDAPLDVVTVVLSDLGDGRTQMGVEQRGGRSPDAYERAGRGWTGFFDRIAERLAAARAKW
jgi:uncharacterized protein YndB with AHSA1/START domain